MERNGAARSRGPLGSPSASSNKTGLSAVSRLLDTGGEPDTHVLLRGELTLDFPLPAPAYGGQRSQPSLEPMTDDGPVRPTILPGLGGGGAPSPRSRDASKPALSKCREPNPASVFHRQPKT